MDAVILHELGYLPFSQNGGALLFHMISKLYETSSLLITTNITVFYNRRRRHSTLGYCPPTQILQDWISKHHQQILAA